MKKHNCECGKMAVWIYMPGFPDKSSPFFCDDCVSRGCSCHHRYVDANAYNPPLDEPDLPNELKDMPFKWIEEGVVWTKVDPQGREWPCVEYDFEEEGFDIDEIA